MAPKILTLTYIFVNTRGKEQNNSIWVYILLPTRLQTTTSRLHTNALSLQWEHKPENLKHVRRCSTIRFCPHVDYIGEKQAQKCPKLTHVQTTLGWYKQWVNWSSISFITTYTFSLRLDELSNNIHHFKNIYRSPIKSHISDRKGIQEKF